MSFVMPAEQREAFLADVHIGVLAVERDGRAPLAVPVWYDYTPGGEVLLWIERDTTKEKLIRKARRFSIAAQVETLPYKYVTAEGPVVSGDARPTEEQARQIAERYLPREQAAKYVQGALGEHSMLIRMRPEKWLSNDQTGALA